MAASRLAAVAAGVAAQVAVGSLGGAGALGMLQLFQSWTTIGAEVAAQGLPTRTMRSIAIDYSARDIPAIYRRLRWAVGRVSRSWLPACLLIAIVFLAVTGAAGTRSADGPEAYALAAALLAAPLVALLRIAAEALKALDAPIPAILAESTAVPLALLVAAGLCWSSRQPMTVPVLLAAGLAAYLLAPALLYLLIRRRIPNTGSGRRSRARGDAEPADDLNVLWASSLLSVAFLHLPFLVLPLFAGTAEIGVYAVGNRLVGIITMLLLLLAAVFGPAFAREAAASGRALPRMLLRSQLLSSAIYLPLAAMLLLGSSALAGLFNVPADDLHWVLVVLGIGHLVNAATGLSGVMLNMVGAARLELCATGAVCLVTLAASPTVGDTFGYQGLAVLFSAAVAAKNLLSYALALHYLHLHQGEANA
jgi:O-antigen/teichoic acid export membrane protein